MTAFFIGWGCATISITVGLALWEKWRPIHRNCIQKPENVECPTCRDTRCVQPNRWTDQMIPCPDCNWKGTGGPASIPENVEEPT